jgi:hypothetical protein
MFRKLATHLPIAILLGAVSAAPALAQPRSHHVVHSPRHVEPSRVTFGSDAYSSYGMATDQGDRSSLGETPAVPWIQNPDSPRG